MSKGRPDYSKGSYYFNPLDDRAVDDEELIRKFPEFCEPNIWPTEVPAMQESAKELGQLLVKVGVLIAKQCDAYIAKQIPGYTPGKLTRIIQESTICKVSSF